MIIPKKCIHIFPNNKPWLSISLKNIINLRNITFIKGDVTCSRELQKQVKRELKIAIVSYKEKVQSLKSGNSWLAWEGVQSIIGMYSKKRSISLSGKWDCELANDLNSFYSHFNVYDFSTELSIFKNASWQQPSVRINSEVVLKLFKGVKDRESPGQIILAAAFWRNM